jgi:hypothetical protein
MPSDLPTDAVTRARSASSQELGLLVHDAREEILLALLDNPNLEEPHVTSLLARLDLTAKVVGAIAEDGRFTGRASVRLALARHPRTPKRIALAMLRQLFLFDLVRLSLMPSAPADVRRAAEELVLARVPRLSIGEKLSLARRGPARIAGALLAEGNPRAIKLALENPFLTESQVLKVLTKSGLTERVAAAIAQHSKWSRMYNIRLALIRNPAAPAWYVISALPEITLRDLRDLAGLECLPSHVRTCIQNELRRRSAKMGNRATR